MSILIKSMKMPSSCWECKLEQFIDCDVFQGITSASEYRDKRYANCPIIELPPHGRLIDADALKAVVCEALKKALDNDSVNLFGAVLAEFVARGFTDEIENAPTIIEAEVSE